jgi:hypothetical protein
MLIIKVTIVVIFCISLVRADVLKVIDTIDFNEPTMRAMSHNTIELSLDELEEVFSDDFNQAKNGLKFIVLVGGDHSAVSPLVSTVNTIKLNSGLEVSIQSGSGWGSHRNNSFLESYLLEGAFTENNRMFGRFTAKKTDESYREYFAQTIESKPGLIPFTKLEKGVWVFAYTKRINSSLEIVAKSYLEDYGKSITVRFKGGTKDDIGRTYESTIDLVKLILKKVRKKGIQAEASDLSYIKSKRLKRLGSVKLPDFVNDIENKRLLDDLNSALNEKIDVNENSDTNEKHGANGKKLVSDFELENPKDNGKENHLPWIVGGVLIVASSLFYIFRTMKGRSTS